MKTVITITGVDDASKFVPGILPGVAYPFVEWGILWSGEHKCGQPRFPSVETIEGLASQGVPLALHLCGKASKSFQKGTDEYLPEAFYCGAFSRIQINGYKPGTVKNFLLEDDPGLFILQSNNLETRTDVVNDALLYGCSVLYDTSGGRGITTPKLPTCNPQACGGYAGGINPSNVASIVEQAKVSGFKWIDMETGVRDGNDHMDIDKVVQVLKQCEPYVGYSL